MSDGVVTARTAGLRLGFLSFVAARGGVDGAAAGLADGLDLFACAEELGFATGWVRQRHFEPFLSSPMVFLTAAAARTRRIHLGTGVVPMRYEEPVRLAADATTLDLLSGGRLELGLGSGLGFLARTLDAVYGATDRGFSAEAAARSKRLREAVAGRPVGTAPTGYAHVPPGGDLHVSPPSPGLARRIWSGKGTLEGAARAGTLGDHLLLSTLNGEETGESFDVAQKAQILAYHRAYAAAGHPGRGRVSAGRIIIPLLDARDEREHRTFMTGYRSGMDAEGRPLDPDAPRMRFSPIIAGTPDDIAATLLVDAALPWVDELILTLPAEGSAPAHRAILTVVADQVLPALAGARAGAPAA